MDTKDLAQWIAIAVTLIISVLVPLLTQIANNRHQEKMENIKIKQEKVRERENAYREFLADVGAAVALTGHNKVDTIAKAGASISNLYMYAPLDWWEDINNLSRDIQKFNYDNARVNHQIICGQHCRGF